MVDGSILDPDISDNNKKKFANDSFEQKKKKVKMTLML